MKHKHFEKKTEIEESVMFCRCLGNLSEKVVEDYSVSNKFGKFDSIK